MRRLFHSGTKTCPLCTEEIDGCYFDKKLDEKIKDQHGKQYTARKQKEERSDVYELPLPGDIIDEIVDFIGACTSHWVRHPGNVASTLKYL